MLIATGAALIQGIPVVWHTSGTHTVTSTRDGTNPKACYLVIEVTMADGTAITKDVCGTAAASPTLPSLAANQDETTYQLPLASFRLPNTGSTTLTTLADVRTYAGQRNPVVSSVVRRTDPLSLDGTTSTAATGATVTTLTTSPVLLTGVTYDIEARGTLAAKIDTGANTVQIAPYIGTTASIADFVSSNLTDYSLMSNVHVREGVVGAGAGVTCALQIRVSGGTGFYSTGTLSVIARPRS